MTSDTPEPQDPVRFSKAKSEPPILDLQAEHSEPQKAAPKTERPKRPWPIARFIGGLIGGGLIALFAVTYVSWHNRATVKSEDLAAALAAKSDQSEFESVSLRVAALESALAELKTTLAAITQRTTGLDTELLKRVDAIEAEIGAISGRNVALPSASPELAIFVLASSIRDRMAQEKVVTKELAALAALGEAGPAFTSLQRLTASPLFSYAELIALVESQPIKSVLNSSSAQADAPVSGSSFMALMNRFVTVRPAETTQQQKKQDLSLQPIIDALTQRNAVKALALIEAMPQSIRSELKQVESEIARRAAAESASDALADDALDLIIKDGKP